MKVLQSVRILVDIGPLDGTIRLPMSGRKNHHMVTKCSICDKSIEDDLLIAGFKAGYSNMMFHEECYKTNADKQYEALMNAIESWE